MQASVLHPCNRTTFTTKTNIYVHGVVSYWSVPPSIFSCISFSTTAKYSAVLFIFSRSSWVGVHDAVVFQCVLNPELLIYAFPQRQLNGRSFRCNRMCNLRCTYCVKRQVHKSHGKGLSPVWSRRCVFRFDVELNFLWHSGHSCGRSPIFPENFWDLFKLFQIGQLRRNAINVFFELMRKSSIPFNKYF